MNDNRYFVEILTQLSFEQGNPDQENSNDIYLGNFATTHKYVFFYHLLTYKNLIVIGI